MNEDQLKVLWDVYGSGQGFESYDEFKSLLQDDTNRKVFFDYSNEELGFTDYNEFEELLGIKKKGVSGQGSDPLTQPLPVKTVPAKVAPKGQATNVKPAPQKQAPAGMQGDPFANQQVPASVGYDARLVRESIKGVKEGLDKTYRIAQEGKRKNYFSSWNTQEAYSYIKPSVDYTEQMLDKIKNIQDPEIQALYTELKNANTQMKDMVGKAWNDGWDEAGVNQYIGGLNRDISNKLDEVDRRMAQLQQPTEQEKKTQETFQKAKFAAPKKEALPAKTEQEIKEEKELEAMPDSGLRLPEKGEVEKYLEGRTYAEKRADFESDPTLTRMYSSYDEYVALGKLGTKYAGEKVSKEQFAEGLDLLNELNSNNQVKAQAEVLEATMGKRHQEINLNQRQQNLNKTYDAWISARNEDPESEETKALAEDLKLLEAEYEEGYRSLDLDYLESMSANQPTLAKEKIDRYNQLIAKKAKGEALGDTEAQFLLNVRREATDAYAVINNAKLIKLREKSDLPGYTKGMAELSVLTQEILGDKSVIQFASEQVSQKAKAAMAPIQAEYGKKRRELSDYESQLKEIDAQLAQLDAEYQLGMKTQQEYEYAFDQLSSARTNVYGLYSTAYSALEELNKAMETAIAPFNTEMSKLQDPYNQKIKELNDKITELKRITGVDDSALAEAEILYKNLATAQQARINANAQYADQYYSEEQNKMLQEERKAANSGVTEFTKSVTRGLSKVVTGLMTLPKGLGLEDSETYGPVDEMYDLARQLEYEAQGTWGALEGEGVSTYLKYAQSIGEGVASTLTFAGTGGLGASTIATSVATSIVLGAGDNYQRAIDLGMDANEAHFYSIISSGGQALSELIYKDAEVFDDVIGNTFIKNVVKNGLSGKQALKVALKEAPKNLAKAGVAISKEGLEEITALVTDDFVNQSTNLVAGKKYFEDNLSSDDFEETAISTGGSTIISRFLFRKSKLDPTSRMALFRSVEKGEKTINLLRNAGASPDKISQAKKDLDEAKLQLSVVESHSNWKLMTDAQKAYAFDVARQLSLNEKALKSNTQNGIQDESLNQQNQELRQELNDALNNPEAVQQQEKVKSNTLEVLESIKNGEDYPQMMSQHPNWNSLSDDQKKEIESLSEDLEEKQREILSLFEVGVESSSTIEQRDAIEGKIAEILNNPIKLVQNDQKDVQGVSGEVGEGKEPVAAEPVEVPGTETPETGGVLQAPGQEEVTPTTEVTTPSAETVTRISEVAPAVRRAGAVEASEGNNQNAGEESALEGVGMDEASLNEWKKANKAPSKKGRIEELAQAVRDLMSGKIKFKDYYQRAKQLMPSKPMDKVPTPATNEEIVGSVDRNKLGIGIINLNKFVKQGMKVGLRIDIPAFNNFGKNVVTVHDRSGSGQPVIGYGSTGSIKNVNFRTSVSTASKIAAGESKSAFAMAQGEWMDESPESIQARAEEALNSPEWVQVGMNPTRNSFFFDKADGNPVVSAEEVLQVGNLVLAKNPKKIDLNTTEGMAEFEKMFSAKSAEGVTYQFREGEGTTTTAPEADAETEEVSPEIAKIEEQRAAELEAFENDENLTDIDGEQVLLTPDGRITSDTINKKYDKEAQYQKGIADAVAEVKKQQNPEYQAALREAIDADPQATTQVHQMAAENILNGAKAADAIASAKQEATQKARAEKARQAMEREGIVSSEGDINKAIKNVQSALQSTGIRVRLIPENKQALFEEERKKAKASDTAEAWFRSKTGEIILSEKALKAGWGSTIVFHEGTHPIINIIRNTNKPLYDKVIKGLRDAAKKEKLNGKPNPLKDVEAWVQKAAGNKTQEQQDDEFITETIARIASGDIQIKRLPLTLKDKLIEFLNKMAKFMGFKRVFLNSPDYEFRRLANQIATTLAKGERIEKVVGKRNVKKYGAKFIQPRAIELLMGKENLSKYGLEPGKKYNVRQIYEAFEKRQKDLFGQIDRKDYSDKTMKQLAEWAKDEVMFMTTQFPEESGTGWYTTKFQAALDEVAKIFPEIGTDPGQRSLFTMLVAIYSDGTKVEKNMSNAIMAYSDYRKTGVIPNTDTGGERNASFNANINEINRLIAEFDGDFEAMTKYLLEEKSGSELAKEAKENGEEFKTDWPAEMILPVASRVFGPKLGMFYSNLMGKEGYPTLDRWFSRLFNRYRGDLMPRLTGLKGKEKDTKGELQGVARFKSFIGKPGISDNKAIEAAKERALQFGSRTKLGDAAKASKMLSPIEKKLGMKQGADKASKEKFKKAAKAAGIKLTGPEFKAHEQFVKDRTGGFWTELEGKVGFKQGSKDVDKKRFDEAAAKLGYDPDSKLYKNHLADKAANTIYKAAFVALNDAPFNRTDRKFMFDTLVEARKMLKKEGVDVTVADIQAILWYYEKKLYVSQGGLESAMGISYQEAAENSVEEYNQNGGKLDTEVTQDDLIDEDGDTDLEDEFIQPSEKAGRGPKPTKAEIDTYLSEQEFFRSTSPFAWAVDAVSRETLESSSIVENEGTYAVVTEDGDIKGVFNPNVAKQREGVPARKNTLNGLIPKAIAAGGIKLDNFDGRLTELYSKNGFKKVSSVPFNEEYAPEGWVKEEHGTPDVVAMVYDPDNKLDIEFKKFDDYGDMISYRDSFVDQARELYQNKSEGNKRVAKAMGIDDTIQPSLPGRFDKNDIPDLIQRSIAGIDADLNKGMSLLEAIENNVTSQDWYPLLSDKEKRQFQSVIESAFEEEVAGLPSEQEEAAEIGVDPNTRQVTSELEDLYYETRDGNRRQRNQAESRRNEIFRGNPKLSYIYKNFDLLSAQLEERGLLTKSIGCP